MPFLSLNDQRQFSNLSLLWIYLIAAIVSTGLTFAASWALERRNPDHANIITTKPSEPGAEVQDLENAFQANDRTLEPAPYIAPTSEELKNGFLDAVRRVNYRSLAEEDIADDVAESSAFQRGDMPSSDGEDDTLTRRRIGTIE